jgi:diguanylate cyclase (GGDEF)-like protein/PAS domain S-box-containing protein
MRLLSHIWPAVTACAVAFGLLFSTWRHRRAPGVRFFFGLAATLVLWSFGAGIETASATFEEQYFWARFQYFGIVFLPPLWLLFALDYTGRRRWIAAPAALLFALPVATLVVAWTNPIHHWLWSEVTFSTTAGPLPDLIVERGPWFWIGHFAYSWVLILLGTLILLHQLVAAPAVYRKQAALLAAASLVPLAVNTAYLTGTNLLPVGDPTPLGFAVSCLLIAWALFRYRLFDLMPIAHEAVFRALGDRVVVVDAGDRIVDLNPAAVAALGRSAEELVGQPAESVFSAWPDLVERFRHPDERPSEVKIETPRGTRHLELAIFPLTGRRGELSGRVVLARDVSERVRYQRRIEELAYQDPVTDLPNRRSFELLGDRALALAARQNWTVALLFIDLDRFKQVNDRHGHAAGDRVLLRVAERLQQEVRRGDLLARFGGDEFVLLLQDSSVEGAESAVGRVRELLRRPFSVERSGTGVTVEIAGSIGYALYPRDGSELAQLVARADEAMYRSKSR